MINNSSKESLSVSEFPSKKHKRQETALEKPCKLINTASTKRLTSKALV